MIGLAGVLMLVAFGLSIAILVRAFRASVLDGVLCLVLPFWTIVVLIKYWKDPDHDIKFFFFGHLLVTGIALGIFSHAAREQARIEAAQEAAREADSDSDDDKRSAAPIDSGSSHRASQHSQRTASTTTESSAPSTRNNEPDTPARAPTAEELAPPPLRSVLHNVLFQRGTMERSSAGFLLDIPDHFHALSATDAHRIEASLRQTPDTHEVAWVSHETVALDAPDAWHVSVRWLPDGWVATGGMLDPWQLLKSAQHAAQSRLAGSGGDLIGYAVAPGAEDAVYSWVEERLPSGAPASVLDCHALKLGRRGVLEFTVAGQPIGTQQLCGATVRLLARHAKFEPDSAYTAAQPESGPRAGYALPDLIAGTH
jgi:hypothetical protein